MSYAQPTTLNEFFDRLADGIFPGADPQRIPDLFYAFRHQCEARFQAGEEEFGDEWMGRDNLAESLEEACDLANYMHFDYLQHLVKEGNDDDIALCLEGARFAYLSWRCTRELAAKRRGAP